MPNTRKNAAKSTKPAPRKKGGKSASSVEPDSNVMTPIDPAEVLALQGQIVERNNALAAQERRISELAAQVAAMQTGVNGSSNPRVTTAASNLDESDEEDDAEMDVTIGGEVGLVPRVNSGVPSGFNRRANQLGHTNTTAHASAHTAPLAVVVAPAPAPAPAPATAPAPAPAPAPALAPALALALAPVAVAVSAPGGATAAVAAPAAALAVPVGGKIRHPGGRVGRGCKLRQAMHLTDNIPLYQEIHRKVLWMFSFAHLPINVYWKHQDQHKLLAISTAVIKSFPYLKNFEPPSWPVMEMLKTMLRNKRGYRKRIPAVNTGLDLNDLDGGFDEVAST